MDTSYPIFYFNVHRNKEQKEGLFLERCSGKQTFLQTISKAMEKRNRRDNRKAAEIHAVAWNNDSDCWNPIWNNNKHNNKSREHLVVGNSNFSGKFNNNNNQFNRDISGIFKI